MGGLLELPIAYIFKDLTVTIVSYDLVVTLLMVLFVEFNYFFFGK